MQGESDEHDQVVVLVADLNSLLAPASPVDHVHDALNELRRDERGCRTVGRLKRQLLQVQDVHRTLPLVAITSVGNG